MASQFVPPEILTESILQLCRIIIDSCNNTTQHIMCDVHNMIKHDQTSMNIHSYNMLIMLQSGRSRFWILEDN